MKRGTGVSTRCAEGGLRLERGQKLVGGISVVSWCPGTGNTPGSHEGDPSGDT